MNLLDETSCIYERRKQYIKNNFSIIFKRLPKNGTSDFITGWRHTKYMYTIPAEQGIKRLTKLLISLVVVG